MPCTATKRNEGRRYTYRPTGGALYYYYHPPPPLTWLVLVVINNPYNSLKIVVSSGYSAGGKLLPNFDNWPLTKKMGNGKWYHTPLAW